MDVLLPQAQQLFLEHGASLDGDRMRFEPEMILDFVGSAPAEFTMHARNPARSQQIGGDNVVFTAVGSPPNSGDIVGGRRTGNHQEFIDLVKLSQHLNAVQLHAGYPVEPADIHASVRHLHAIRDIVTLSDKPVNAYSLGAQRNRDALEILRLAHGLTDDEVDEKAIIYTVINTSSPLRLDHPMATGIIEYAGRGQASIITPFTLAGAMAPVTIAGAVVQWLRDGLGIIGQASDTQPLADKADPQQRLYLVPAFTGMGAPHWDSEARGAVFGLTRNSGPREFARAALEAVCFQTNDLLAAMKADWSDASDTILRVDGGMTASDWTMQCLADVLDAPVERPVMTETTALGVAYLAGAHVGFYGGQDTFAQRWKLDRSFTPAWPSDRRERKIALWNDAVSRTLSSRN